MQKKQIRLSCKGCRHFFVTYDPNKPWGCRQFGFKGRNLPAEIVYQSTGMQCAYYQRRPGMAAEASEKSQTSSPWRIDKQG